MHSVSIHGRCGRFYSLFGGYRYVYALSGVLSDLILVKAESIAPRLLEYFGRFGPLTEIVSNQGTKFSNALMKAMLRQ